MKLTVSQFISLWAACGGSVVKFNTAVTVFKANEEKCLKDANKKKEEKKV